MGDFVEFIKSIRDLSFGKILVVVLALVLVIGLWKVDSFYSVYDSITKKLVDSSTTQQQSSPTVETKTVGKSAFLSDPEDLQITPESLDKIKKYTVQYLTTAPREIVLVTIFKFLPEGDDYLYQGRVLVYLNSSLRISSSDDLVKELNMRWIPMWSGRKVVEDILTGDPTVIDVFEDGTVFSRKSNRKLQVESVNMTMLADIGVRGAYFFPIKKGSRVVAYITIFSDEKITADLENDFNSLCERISSHIVNYLIERP